MMLFYLFIYKGKTRKGCHWGGPLSKGTNMYHLGVNNCSSDSVCVNVYIHSPIYRVLDVHPTNLRQLQDATVSYQNGPTFLKNAFSSLLNQCHLELRQF